MDEFSQFEKVNLAYTVRVLMNCFSSDANMAMAGICQDPETVALLSLACRSSVYGMDNGFEATEKAVERIKSE
jgi:hypothetical protein